MTQLRVTASSLNVRKVPALDGAVLGSLPKGSLVEQLEASADDQWLKVRLGALSGWSSHRYLVAEPAAAPPGPLQPLLELAQASAIATHHWADRGVAPRGYIKGMALVYARVYCHCQAGEAAALDMARAATANGTTDALAHYAPQFAQLGMSNDTDGVDTLRHLFVLLLGLGMRESSGRWCEGRDMSAANTSADTAEAGLFQTSWNAHSASPLLSELFVRYRANPDGFRSVFEEGVHCSPGSLQNHGSGDGLAFQQLSKDCPAFAAEFAAVGLRHLRRHWGPINTHTAELRPEADQLFLAVQQVVDSCKLCPALTA
jgi:hypothetical protein